MREVPSCLPFQKKYNMAKKINTVLLIDDDLTINYLHNRLIEKSAIAEHVIIAKNGIEGISVFLELNERIHATERVIIFLDLNMPIMNGWEFLEKLSKAKNEITMHYKIYILSSTINPDDKKKAKSHSLVSGFLSKPLTKGILEQLQTD
jgi:CheY-like chemotaxis protein